MLYPSNSRSNINWNPYRYFGIPTRFQYSYPSGSFRSQYTNFPKTAGVPSGYGAPADWVTPYVAGQISSYNNNIETTSQSGNLLNGGLIEANESFLAFSQTADVSLVVSMSGTTTVVFQGNNIVLAMTINLDGSGTATLQGDGNVLSMTVPFDGVGSWILSATGDVRSRLSMIGEFTPFTELSPQSLAGAVWSSVAVDSNEAGTMGEKVNSLYARPKGVIVTDGGNAVTTFKTDLTQTGTDYWKEALILFTSGNLINQVRKIVAYDGTTKFITVDPAFPITPNTGSEFVILTF